MEKFITDERTGLRYELVGDYYLIAGEDEPEGRPVGIWRQRHLRYIRRYKRHLYSGLLIRGKLNYYLAEHKRAGRENVLSSGKTTCRKGRCNGSAQSRKANAVGAEDEQHPQRR